MKIEYKPWGESHAPQRFHRTDPTGRWSPISDYERMPPNWVAVFMVAGWAAMMAAMLVMLFLEVV